MARKSKTKYPINVYRQRNKSKINSITRGVGYARATGIRMFESTPDTFVNQKKSVLHDKATYNRYMNRYDKYTKPIIQEEAKKVSNKLKKAKTKTEKNRLRVIKRMYAMEEQIAKLVAKGYSVDQEYVSRMRTNRDSLESGGEYVTAGGETFKALGRDKQFNKIMDELTTSSLNSATSLIFRINPVPNASGNIDASKIREVKLPAFNKKAQGKALASFVRGEVKRSYDYADELRSKGEDVPNEISSSVASLVSGIAQMAASAKGVNLEAFKAVDLSIEASKKGGQITDGVRRVNFEPLLKELEKGNINPAGIQSGLNYFATAPLLDEARHEKFAYEHEAKRRENFLTKLSVEQGFSGNVPDAVQSAFRDVVEVSGAWAIGNTLGYDSEQRKKLTIEMQSAYSSGSENVKSSIILFGMKYYKKGRSTISPEGHQAMIDLVELFGRRGTEEEWTEWRKKYIGDSEEVKSSIADIGQYVLNDKRHLVTNLEKLLKSPAAKLIISAVTEGVVPPV